MTIPVNFINDIFSEINITAKIVVKTGIKFVSKLAFDNPIRFIVLKKTE